MSRLRAHYLAALRSYLADPGEETLRAAYELGRETVARERGLLDLSMAHEDALAATLEAEPGSAGAAPVVRAAGEFFLECISAFEMVQRGVRDAHEAARVERRHAEMLRGLSDFLSDSSLALQAPDALAEMRRLVAEQAREFVGAQCCFVTTSTGPGPAERAASLPEDDVGWRAFARWADLSAVDEVVWSAGGPVRLARADVADVLGELLRGPAEGIEIRGWLGAPLTALGGHALGAVHLVNKLEGDFTALDEAVAVHLAQMSAAAVERAQLYAGGA
jgi:GAF domain-containing protein